MLNIKDLIEKYDKSDMFDSILTFPSQINTAFSIMEEWNTDKEYTNIKNILILGMGGSAIGGDACRVLVQDECKIPIYVNRSYNIPNWVDKDTLIIASSYSGNTEETLSAFNKCFEANTSIIAISTGGRLIDIVSNHNLDNIILPAGMQPRAAFGISLSITMIILGKLGFIGTETIDKLSRSSSSLTELSKDLSDYHKDNPALTLANEIHTMCPVIYGSEDLTWVAALRLRGQLQENAKMLAFHNSVPEQNHNEIEGWTCNPTILETKCIIWLKDEEDHPRSIKRMEITSELLKNQAGKQFFISQTGSSKLLRLLKMIHFNDWVSYYCALFNKVDPSPVHRIMDLKQLITNQ